LITAFEALPDTCAAGPLLPAPPPPPPPQADKKLIEINVKNKVRNFSR
jgi:hypothetical protein